MVHGQLEEAQVVLQGIPTVSLPKFVQWPVGQNTNLQEQMAPRDSSIRTDMK